MRPTLCSWVACISSIALLALSTSASAAEPNLVIAPLKIDEIPVVYRDRVSTILNQPSFHVHGPSETFLCETQVYHWLLDHPDKAAKAWQGLGAECADILAIAPGHCSWQDENGSEVHWYNIVRTTQRRVWYAEGTIKPGRLLPRMPVRALVILHVQQKRQLRQRAVLQHQGELYLHVSSRAFRLATRLLGASGPRMAKDYVGQIETFFGTLASYLTKHPEHWKKVILTSATERK